MNGKWLAKPIRAVKGSIRLKLVIGFLLIVTIVGGAAIASFSSLRTYLLKEDRMIERTIVANQIVDSSGEITTIISGYILTNMPDYKEKKQKVFDELDKIKKNIAVLDGVIIDRQAKKTLSELKSLVSEYEIVLEDIYLSSEKNKLQETASQKDRSRKIASWIQDSVAELISAELSYQQVVKYELNRKANLIGLVVYGIILLVVLLSIGFAMYFSNRVGGDISNLARTARKIAGGDLDVKPFEVKSKDELSILSESFNYMVAEIKKLISGIEEKAQVEKKLKEQEIQNLEFSNLLNEAELRFLQSQINPHFLFNTMNTIASMAKARKADDIKRVIECVADILRYNLKKLDETVTLGEEFDIIKNYVFIQQMRFGDKIDYRFNVDEAALEYRVPSMILQPFVENSITHGLEPKEGDGVLELSITVQEENILIRIRDNGVGMDDKTLQDIRTSRGKMSGGSRSGIGVNNVIRRLELVYGRNVVEIDSRPEEGTIVRITLDKHFAVHPAKRLQELQA